MTISITFAVRASTMSSSEARDQALIKALRSDYIRVGLERDTLKKKVLMLQDNIKVLSEYLNKGGHSTRKRRKKGASDEIDTCTAVVESVMMTTIWPKRKFLPKTWKEWRPQNPKSTSSVLMSAVEKNIPSCFTTETFWHVYMTEICGKWFVHRRNADTSRMKSLHARK